MKRIVFISLLSTIMVLAAAGESYACSCLAPSPDTPIRKVVSEAKASAGAVFVGKVISIRNTEHSDPFGSRQVTIEVTRSWKGLDRKKVEIITAGNGAACGVGFEVGKVFIIYADKDTETDKLHASLCSRTQITGGKSDDEKYLGKRLKLKSK